MNEGFEFFDEYLKKVALVKQEDLNKFHPFLSVKKFRKGEILLAKGSVCKHIFFVEKGLLRFYTINRGKEHILQFASENSWLSDRNNLSNSEPSDYFIDAYEDTSVVMLNQEFIIRASKISAEFSTFHEHLLQRHIKQLYRRISSLIGTPAKDCYSDFLKTYPNIIQRVPQWMIASYLGITPESLSRIRKELSQKG